MQSIARSSPEQVLLQAWQLPLKAYFEELGLLGFFGAFNRKVLVFVSTIFFMINFL